MTYRFTSGKPLLDGSASLESYQARLASIHQIDLSALPLQLQETVRAMLSPTPSARPPVVSFIGSQYFQASL